MPLEEVVMTMKVRQDRIGYYTNIQTEHIYPASQMLASIISFGPQPNKALVGANAFAHEAGIHQDGYLKEKSTYEIIDPQSVGIPEGRLVLGKHSGATPCAPSASTSATSSTRKSWMRSTRASLRSPTARRA